MPLSNVHFGGFTHNLQLLVSLAGLEPATTSLEGCRSIQLSYRDLENYTGVEPVTLSFANSCSTVELIILVPYEGIEPPLFD
jgi:hypothetical protein